MHEFTDEQLTAYLDGELEHIPSAEIERELLGNPKLEERLKRLEFDMDSAAIGFEAMLKAAPKMPDISSHVNVKAANDNTWLSRNMIAISTVAVMLLGSVVGYGVGVNKQDGWREYVAAYQYLYITSTLSHIEQSDQASITELERVGDAIGKGFELAYLQNFDGMDYKRSQILGFEGKPLAQLTFLSKMGEPIALCIIRKPESAEADVEITKLEGLASAHWSKGGYEYLLIGGNDDVMIDEAAQYFAAKI